MTSNSATSRVARWAGDRFDLHREPVAEPGPGEVLVAIIACMVCLTEVHFVDGVIDFPIPEPLGHEFVGVVEGGGPRTEGFPPGTLVAAAGSLCGFSDTIVADVEKLVVLPPGTPIEHGCFVEPLSACHKAIRKAQIPAGGTLLITGAGTNGLLTLQLARRMGAARVIVSEPDAARRGLASVFGANRVIDPTATSLPDALAGEHVDVVIETAGRLDALVSALEILPDGGRVVLFGVHPTQARLDLHLLPIHRRDLSLITSMGYARDDVLSVVRWLPELSLATLVTHRFELGRLDDAFDVARSGAGLKAIVYPGGVPAPSGLGSLE
jgi:2-desacetyl-2-hydroxyethyl bacteriochlorophyllide A dehydrogenase